MRCLQKLKTNMSSKGILIAVLLSMVCQLNAADKKTFSSQIETRWEFVIINKVEYFIDIDVNYRDESEAKCQSINMTLITFETPGKYADVRDWLAANGYEFVWFWTGALKDANSSRWYWEKTGNDVSEFLWGPRQPDITDDSVRICIDFRTDRNWEDDQCDKFPLGRMCEHY